MSLNPGLSQPDGSAIESLETDPWGFIWSAAAPNISDLDVLRSRTMVDWRLGLVENIYRSESGQDISGPKDPLEDRLGATSRANPDLVLPEPDPSCHVSL